MSCEICDVQSDTRSGFFLPVLPFSPVSHIPPLLCTHLHFVTTLMRRTSGRRMETFQKAMLFRKSRALEGKMLLSGLYLIPYLLTYSMVQSPSWEANWFAANQEIPRISRNPKVHYRTHKRPPTVSILGQPNPVHIPTSHLLEIHPNIIHTSTPRSPQWSLSLRFPHQDPIHPPLLTHMRHMLSPSHSSAWSWKQLIRTAIKWHPFL